MTTTINTSDDLYELLAGLGSTADEIVDTLRAAGIKGLRQEAAACPIANWLVLEANAWDVEVDGIEVSIRAEGSNRAVHCSPPHGVYMFVLCFDNRRYPDLEAGQGTE